MDTCTSNDSSVGTDSRRETFDAALADLNRQLNLLERQNVKIQSKLEEENKKCLKIAKLIRNRRPFSRTKTGEIVFPGKKEIKHKLELMKREIVKLRATLNRFEKNRIILESNFFLVRDEDNAKERIIIEQLDEQYRKLKNEFDQKLLEVAKYRTKMDLLRKELDVNKKKLEETQINVNGLTTRLEHLMAKSISENQQIDWERELSYAKDRVENLKMIAERGMDELKEKKKSYANALQDKENKKYQVDVLCQEKARVTAEFKTEFDGVKRYLENRLRDVKKLPVSLNAVQSQLEVQRNTRTSAENAVEILSKRLKSLIANPHGDSVKNLKTLEKLTAENIKLKNERDKMERIFADIQSNREETERNTVMQRNRLDRINAEAIAKIDGTRRAYGTPAADYLRTIDLLENHISKVKAHCCREDGNQRILSKVTRKTVNALDEIIEDTRRIINDMSSMNT